MGKLSGICALPSTKFESNKIVHFTVACPIRWSILIQSAFFHASAMRMMIVRTRYETFYWPVVDDDDIKH